MKLNLKLVTAISFVLYIIGCNNQEQKLVPVPPSTLRSDTITNDNKKVDTGSFSQANPSEILKDYVKAYEDTIKVDTSVKYNGKKLKILFTYYCTFDSALHVPNKYVAVYGLREFTTHNFRSSLKISSEGIEIIDTVIDKEMFKDKIFDEEKKYGALLYPNLSFSEKGVMIDYSISIPLSDVGVGVSLECDYSGNLKVKKSGG